jgi:hypothetical protein
MSTCSAATGLVRLANSQPEDRPCVPKDQLPVALQGYPPALRWHPSTVEYWLKLTQDQIGDIVGKDGRRFYPVPKVAFAEISIDCIRTLGGLTPWMRLPGNQIGHDETGGAESHAMLFAGKWIVPELNVISADDALAIDRVADMQAKAPGSQGRARLALPQRRRAIDFQPEPSPEDLEGVGHGLGDPAP